MTTVGGGGGVITRIDVKGRKLANVAAPAHLEDVANKQYVDYTCLRFTTPPTDKKKEKNEAAAVVIDARDHRIQSLGEPICARDAATKGYVCLLYTSRCV